ncbi:hypothetical protein RGUI_4106 [Rhodovulum sp. P5]|nr:hypothetical protein RGUI_4106 [Rhodovulum sp. P5]
MHNRRHSLSAFPLCIWSPVAVYFRHSLGRANGTRQTGINFVRKCQELQGPVPTGS